MLILPDREQFQYKDCVVHGDECTLIIPNSVGTTWTDENARFRSCLFRKSDHHILSQSFKKFTNFFETPDFQPWNPKWKIDARHKIDGSALIISVYKGQHVIRTRGTSDARQLDNGWEIDILIEKYPLLFDNPVLYSEKFTIICEWTTKNNVIVIREHEEPTLTLLGVVHNESAIYTRQYACDWLAECWNVGRPEKYKYNTVEECIKDVGAWKGKEGVVLYSPDGNTLKKIKASEYLRLHSLATGTNTINKIIDLFLESGKFTNPEEFHKYICTTLDFEVAEKIRDDINDVCAAYKKVCDKLVNVTKIVDGVRRPDLFTRKDQARIIVEHWSDYRKSMAFLLLDNREIDDRLMKTAIETEMNKNRITITT